MIMLYLVSFVFILSIVVIVHEGGHFFAARRCGVQVEAFSVGFGKKLWSRKDKKGTEWRICAIPLGGYVQMLGDEDPASTTKTKKKLTEEEKKKTFFAQPVYKRACIIFAGPFMNYVLATVIFACVLATVGYVKIPAKVGEVMPDSVAMKAGIQKGDLILAVNQKDISDFSDLKRAIVLSTYGQTISLDVLRDGKKIRLSATPELVGEEKTPRLGVVSDMTAEPTFERYDNPFTAIGKAVQMVWQINTDTVIYLKQVISGRRSASDLRGPIGIAEASGDAARGGFLMLILFLAQVSIGIGFVNLLPVPILDGGHLVLLAYEAVARKPLSEKIQNGLLRLGAALLLTLVVFTLFKDVPRVVARVFGW